MYEFITLGNVIWGSIFIVVCVGILVAAWRMGETPEVIESQAGEGELDEPRTVAQIKYQFDGMELGVDGEAVDHLTVNRLAEIQNILRNQPKQIVGVACNSKGYENFVLLGDVGDLKKVAEFQMETCARPKLNHAGGVDIILCDQHEEGVVFYDAEKFRQWGRDHAYQTNHKHDSAWLYTFLRWDDVAVGNIGANKDVV